MNILVNVDVDDLDRGVRFYTEAVGLRAGRRLGEGVAELLGASSPIYLLAKPQGSGAFPGAAKRRHYGRHWTPVHLDFVVDDVETSVARALGAGATLEQAPATHVWGKLALLADPFGNGFCLLQFLGRGYDELAA